MNVALSELKGPPYFYETHRHAGPGCSHGRHRGENLPGLRPEAGRSSTPHRPRRSSSRSAKHGSGRYAEHGDPQLPPAVRKSRKCYFRAWVEGSATGSHIFETSRTARQLRGQLCSLSPP